MLQANDENNNKNVQFDFKSLAPRKDVDLYAYKEAFDFVFSNKEIRNVAVTGSYGAGKSSVLESFKAVKRKEEDAPEIKYLHISLAHFEKTVASEGKKMTDEQLEHQLEGKIINQLVHKITPENIPDTRVALRRKLDEESVINWSLGIITGIIASLYLIFFQSMIGIATKKDIIGKLCSVLIKPEWLMLAVVIEIMLIYLLIKYLVSAQMKNRFFKKICIKNSEIELFGEDEDNDRSKSFSYFDRYLDEIKYLLLNSGIDVFVFEDIDRYNMNLIFEKLREINDIVNTNRDEPIRFFYLIRDDIFVQKDRTKFFDFIIPVLPVVSGHNSFNMYLEYMGEHSKLKRHFLKQISLYIDDMRVLNNIYNEYQIYRKRLDEISVGNSEEKIFSLVTYKNLFPEDFIRLQQGDGYIMDLFKQKEMMVSLQSESYRLEVENLEAAIEEEEENAKNILLRDKKEVDALYLELNRVYRCNNKERGDYENLTDFVVDIIQQPEEVEYKQGNAWYDAEDEINAAIKKMKKNPDYIKRREELERKEAYLSNKRQELYYQKSDFEDKQEALKGITFQEFCNDVAFSTLQENITTYDDGMWNEYNKKISESLYAELIQFLLVNGYVDENYGDFIVMFHGSDVCKEDKKYVRSVLDNEPLAYDYEIQKPSIVSEYLNEKNLQNKAAINLDMFIYYMNFGTEEQRQAVVDAICKWKAHEFVVMLLNNQCVHYLEWVERLGDNWHTLFELIKANEVDEELLKLFATVFFMCPYPYPFDIFNDEDFMFFDDVVFKDASIFEQVLEHDQKNEHERKKLVQNFAENLLSLEWTIPYFEFDMNKSKDFADAIYTNNLYEIKLPMIAQILEKYYEISVDENVSNLYDKIVYTCEKNKNEQTYLYKYINNNMNEFIEMLIDSDFKIQDSAKAILEMIEKADFEHQESLIQHMDTIIDSVDDVSNQSIENPLSVINRLIRHKKLAYTTQNIFTYYDLYMDLKENDGDMIANDLLIEFIAGFPEGKIQFKRGEVARYRDKNEDRISSLFVKICRSEALSDEKYRSLTIGLNRAWINNAPPTDLPYDGVNILIEEDIIKMNEQVLPGMRERYPNHLKKYILDNIEDYVNKAINENTFVWQECLMVLRENVANEYKKKLLSYSTESVSVQNDYYSDEMVLYILNNNFDENDLEYIINNNYQDVDLKQKVLEIAELYMDEILENEYSMDKEYCMSFLRGEVGALSLADKKAVFAQSLICFTRKEVVDILRELELYDFISLFNNKNPLIEKTVSNRLLLTALQENNLVGTFLEDEKEPEYYRVYSKKFKKN